MQSVRLLCQLRARECLALLGDFIPYPQLLMFDGAESEDEFQKEYPNTILRESVRRS